MNVKLLLEPPFLVHHVGSKFTVRHLLGIFAAMPLATDCIVGQDTPLYDRGAICHYPSIN